MAWEAGPPGPHQPAPLPAGFRVQPPGRLQVTGGWEQSGHFLPFSARPGFGLVAQFWEVFLLL